MMKTLKMGVLIQIDSNSFWKNKINCHTVIIIKLDKFSSKLAPYLINELK